MSGMLELRQRLARVGRVLAAIPRQVRTAVVRAWTWLIGNGARVVATVWLGGLAVFVGTVSIETWEAVAASSAADSAAKAERKRQIKAIQNLEFKDIDELEGYKDNALRKYGTLFEDMVPDAGPPREKGKKGGGISGWIARNKKHSDRAVSDKETLKLLRQEMGEEFGALEELADTSQGGVQGTLARMKQISKLRGGKGSRVPSDELVKEMAGHGFDEELLGKAKPNPTSGREDSEDGEDGEDGDSGEDGETETAGPDLEPRELDGQDDDQQPANDAGAEVVAETGPADAGHGEASGAAAEERAGFRARDLGGAGTRAFGAALLAAVTRLEPTTIKARVHRLAPAGSLDFLISADEAVIKLPILIFRDAKRDKLTDDTLSLLTGLAPLLASLEGWSFRVVGDLDASGSERKRLRRSKARALAVGRHLVKSGLAGERVRVAPALIAGGTQERIEIHLIHTGGGR